MLNTVALPGCQSQEGPGPEFKFTDPVLVLSSWCQALWVSSWPHAVVRGQHLGVLFPKPMPISVLMSETEMDMPFNMSPSELSHPRACGRARGINQPAYCSVLPGVSGATASIA